MSADSVSDPKEILTLTYAADRERRKLIELGASAILAYTIDDATKVTHIGRTTLYAAIGAGRIKAVKSGTRTLILAESLRAFLSNLPAADIGNGQSKIQRPAA